MFSLFLIIQSILMLFRTNTIITKKNRKGYKTDLILQNTISNSMIYILSFSLSMTFISFGKDYISRAFNPIFLDISLFEVTAGEIFYYFGIIIGLTSLFYLIKSIIEARKQIQSLSK